MKLLIIAWFFPPVNTIAAVRLGRMCKYLVGRGHGVNVVSAKDLPYPKTLPLEIADSRVVYAPWTDLSRFPSAVIARLKRLIPRSRARGHGSGLAAMDKASPASPVPQEATVAMPAGILRRAMGWLRRTYIGIINWPDNKNGWIPGALQAASAVMSRSRPDVVFASGPPFSAFLIGRFLSRRHGVPWIAEFRDRWCDDPYDPPPHWLLALNRFAERRLVASASAIVTVSEPWAKTYREKYGKPTAVVYNGYDAEILDAAAIADAGPSDVLRIVYTGGIYPGRRDPAPLFAALNLLPDEARNRVRIDFYGTDPSHVWPLADAHGVRESVVIHPPVTQVEAVRAQRNADVLLLMQWNNPKEQGNVPGKFFEYLGARRPILVLGLEGGVPATIVGDRGAGVCANDPARLVELLNQWLEAKQRLGRIPDLPEAARDGFSRVEQYQKLERFLDRILATASGRSADVKLAPPTHS